jgi:hypothetical protein
MDFRYIGASRYPEIIIYKRMAKRTNKLIDKVISSLDWDSIHEVNKCFKIGIGEGTSVIPGIKRKIFSDSLTKNDIKGELKTLLVYAIENDIAELFYGPWMIFWINGEWIEIKEGERDNDDDDDEEGDVRSTININIQSSLEVIYSPQRIHIVGNAPKNEGSQDESDASRLEVMLKKALDTESYEIATKIKELLALQNGGATEDK